MGAARLSASHCGSGQGDSWSPRPGTRPCFRGAVRSVRSCTAASTGRRRPCAFPRVLPAPEKRTYCPRTASTSHAGHCAGRMMPDAARERVTNPPAGTALAPSQGVSSRRTSLRKARWSLLVRRAGWIQEIPPRRCIALMCRRFSKRVAAHGLRQQRGTKRIVEAIGRNARSSLRFCLFASRTFVCFAELRPSSRVPRHFGPTVLGLAQRGARNP